MSGASAATVAVDKKRRRVMVGMAIIASTRRILGVAVGLPGGPEETRTEQSNA